MSNGETRYGDNQIIQRSLLFYSKRVGCLGMIKDLVVNLAQIPVKSVVIDIVVVDIPTRFGMLFSRSWVSNIRVSIKLGLTYATIHIFGGEERRLYRESRFVKTVTRDDCPNNAHVYGTKMDISCFTLE